MFFKLDPNLFFYLLQNYSIDIDWIIIITIKVLVLGIFHSEIMSIKSLLNQDPKHDQKKKAEEERRKRLHLRVFAPCPDNHYQPIVAVKNLDTGCHVSALRLETFGNYRQVFYRSPCNLSFKPAFTSNYIQNSDHSRYMLVPLILSRNNRNIDYLTGPVSNPETVHIVNLYGRQYMRIKKDSYPMRML